MQRFFSPFLCVIDSVLYFSMLVHDSSPTNAPTHTLILSGGEKTDSYELVLFVFLIYWSSFCGSGINCFTSSATLPSLTSVVIKLKKVNEITRLICQHDFIFGGGGWNDNISWMVLKLHYKRAIVCFYQVVRFLRGGLWVQHVPLIQKRSACIIKIHFRFRNSYKSPNFLKIFDRISKNNKLQCNW